PAISRALPPHHLDRKGLRQGIAERRQHLLDLETALVAACEARAARGRARGVRMDDRETWDKATWTRYLDAATTLEPEYDPRMRRLLREIDRLARLAELPVGMDDAA
ncbi:MAG: hypothetical protein ABI369_16150, partial [Acetobacteraceae bacterium]